MPAENTKGRRYIRDLGPGERIEDQVFLVTSKDLRQTTNNSLYIHVVLADRTGQLLARIWQATDAQFQQIPEGGFLRVRGRTESYKGSLQFIIEGMRSVEKADVDLSDFVPATDKDVDAMWERVKEILRTIRNRDLLMLIKQFVEDEEIVERFKRAPAATQLHHSFLGGLLEHTLNVLELALVVIPRYPEVSLDLVLAGVFLHDIGKTTELCYDTNFRYSDAGQLIGHIVQAVIWVEQKSRDAAKATGKPFPEEIKLALQHIIVSHHGQYDFGSPKLPATPEAIAVHYLDNLDAKLYSFLHEIRQADKPDDNFTDYIRSLETKVYKKDVMGIRK
ncbi:MAG: 3'-5' exoribonuclease YhaM family protein [Phycisphaerae bacterium]